MVNLFAEQLFFDERQGCGAIPSVTALEVVDLELVGMTGGLVGFFKACDGFLLPAGDD